MKKDLLLVLGIYEGQSWRPVEGHRTLVEARLESNSFATDPVPLSSCPGFHTEISWSSDSRTLHRLKVKRTPIKVECFDIDEKGSKKLLGYVILSISSAVEGVKGDKKWYKLLGGPSASHKFPPQIQLSLSVESMTLDQNQQVKKWTVEKPGGLVNTVDTENPTVKMCDVISSLSQTNGLIQDVCSQRNGTKSIMPVQPQTIPPQSVSYCNGNGSTQAGKGAVTDDDVDIYNFDDDDDDDADHNELEDDLMDEDDYSQWQPESSSVSLSNRVKDRLSDQVDANSNSDLVQKPKFTYQLAAAGSVAAPIVHGKPSPGFLHPHTMHDSEPEQHKSSLTSALFEEWESNQQTLMKEILKCREAEKSQINDSTGSCVRTGENLFRGATKPPSSCSLNKVPECAEQKASSSFDAGSSLKSFSRDENSPNQIFWEQCQDSGLFERKDLIVHSGTGRLRAYLDESGGFIQIGDSNCEDKVFVFEVTIVQARNLSKVVPHDVVLSPTAGLCFSYSLFEIPVKTDPFYDLDNPDFLAQKATATIHASTLNMSRYIDQYSYFPVSLISGDACLAKCIVDLNDLVEISTKNSVKKEGNFMLYSGSRAASARRSSEAHVSMVFELSVTGAAKSADLLDVSRCIMSSLELSPQTDCKTLFEPKFSKSSGHRAVFSDEQSKSIKRTARYVCMCSDSSEDSSHDSFCMKCSKFSRKELVSKRRSRRSLEKLKKEAIQEAALEIDMWKEDQMQKFLQEWEVRQSSLQQHLSKEWGCRIKEVDRKLDECQHLQEKLNSALKDLSVQEESLQLRENKVREREEAVVKLHSQILTEAKMLSENPSQVTQVLQVQLDLERRRRTMFEEQISDIEQCLKEKEAKLKEQNQEITSLRMRLINNDNCAKTSKDEVLEQQLSTALEKKQYYKLKWVQSISEMYKMKTRYQAELQDIRHATECSSAQPFITLPPVPSPELSLSKLHSELKALVKEKEGLLLTKTISVDHPHVRSIDRKIKSIIESLE